MARSAWPLEPVWKGMKPEVLKSRVIQTDDTRCPCWTVAWIGIALPSDGRARIPGRVEAGEPAAIPEGRWIDIRLHEEPAVDPLPV